MFCIHTLLLELKNTNILALTGSSHKSSILSLAKANKKGRLDIKTYFGNSPYLRLFAAQSECPVCVYNSLSGFFLPEFS